jgi:hypothetical protein
MAKAKASAVQADNDIGHNSGELAEQDRKVLFFINRRIYLAKLEAKKTADAALKLAAKQVKADLGENGLHQIKTYEKARTAEGAEEIKAKSAAEAQAMRFAGMPEGTQLDLLEDRAPLDERAFRDGEEAGLRGDTLANPYNEASEAGQQYAAGWHQGQSALFAGIKKKEEASADELIKGDDEADDGDPFEEAAE